MPLFVTIVLDGVGIGAQPDAHAYGEADADTLGHVVAQERPHLPNLQALGLGNIRPFPDLPSAPEPHAAFGRMQEASAGMDSTTGHWEMAGVPLDTPFPTYAQGFPASLIARFVEATGCGSALDGGVASGTEVIERLGEAHQATGFPLLYTSADSVFQIATHVDTVPLDTLYNWCRTAREHVCVGDHAVGRVIARPFTGAPSGYMRLSEKRQDYAIVPPVPPIQAVLQAAGVRTVAIGKIGDLFAGVGFDDTHKTKSNAQGIAQTLAQMRILASSNLAAFVWTNLVDFDQEYGHRNDAPGFARALEAFDAALPDLLGALPADGRLVITADHGNDPTTPSTDHNREYAPLLVCGEKPRDLGTRATFADHAATVAAYFGVPFEVGTPWSDSKPR